MRSSTHPRAYGNFARLYFMSAVDDLRETRAFMADLRDHLAGRLAELRTIEREIFAAHATKASSRWRRRSGSSHRCRPPTSGSKVAAGSRPGTSPTS